MFENFEAMKAHEKKERWKAAGNLLTVGGCLMTVGFFLAFGVLMSLAYALIWSMG